MRLLIAILARLCIAPFATIKLGPVVSDARGSVGGTVFSRGPFGAYMKARVAPTNPNTDKQAAARALLTTIVNEWMTVLTVAQRDVWNAAVQQFTVPNRIGDPVQLTGLQWFVRCNCLLSLSGQALVTTPPVVPIIPAPTLTLAHVAAAGVQVTDIGDWDNTAISQTLLQRSANLSPTKNFWKGPWFDKVTIAGAAYGALPLLIMGSGTLAIDSRVFISWRSVNTDGANSFPVIYSQDVGDPV